MKVLLLILVSLSTLAHEHGPDCGPVVHGEPIHNLEEFSSRLEHWSANQAQVMNAPCKHRSFDTPQMNFELTSMTGTKGKLIRGVRFQDENPELLKVFKRLTSRNEHNWLERILLGASSRSEINFQDRYQVNPECQKVLCAVDRIWGQFLGRKLLYLNLKFGYNASEFPSPNAARFSEPEVDTLLMGLSDLPQSIMPLNKNRPLTKFQPTQNNPGRSDSIWADSRVTLYAPWFRGPQGLQFQTLIHEVGHNLHYKLPVSKFNQWAQMSSWVKMGENWQYDTLGACMPSHYAMTSPQEDFAETASAYRYNARALFARCPEKYQFMKENVFAGVEYREESQCSGR